MLNALKKKVVAATDDRVADLEREVVALTQQLCIAQKDALLAEKDRRIAASDAVVGAGSRLRQHPKMRQNPIKYQESGSSVGIGTSFIYRMRRKRLPRTWLILPACMVVQALVLK